MHPLRMRAASVSPQLGSRRIHAVCRRLEATVLAVLGVLRELSHGDRIEDSHSGDARSACAAASTRNVSWIQR